MICTCFMRGIFMKNNFFAEFNKNRSSYLFLTPFTLIFLLFTIIPIVIAIYFSFTSFNIFNPPQFNGFENYRKLFLEDEIFLIAIKNTFVFAAITGPLGYILSFVMAWLINEITPKVRSFVTLLFYAPALTSGVTIFKFVFSGDRLGLINAYLMDLNIINEPIQWLMDPAYMKPVVIIVILWSSLSTSFLTFIAGLQSNDQSLCEAGAVDGIKNRFQELWYIILPQMKPQLLFGAVMSITSSFGVGAIVTQLMGFPSSNYAAHTMSNHLDDYGSIRFEMGYACAISTLLFIVMLLSNKIIQKLISKVGN